MTTEAFARVVFQSPLPALDREFDYAVPEELMDLIQVGARVKVPFAGKDKEGYVVALSGSPQFTGKLSEIRVIVSPVSVLQPHIYQLLRAIASRQCCSVGELIENAVPKRSIRVEKGFHNKANFFLEAKNGIRTAQLVRPVADQETGLPMGLISLCDQVANYFNKSTSVIVSVPDFRDVTRLKQLFETRHPGVNVVISDSSDVASSRYTRFLDQLSGRVQVVLGTRSVIYSPVPAGSAVFVWDDGDQSHQDQQSPYLTTREIALIRQSLFGCDLHFISHSRSTEVQRLVSIGYLQETETSNWWPKVALSEGKGLDGISFKAIKSALEVGPVLIQVAAPGQARSLFCDECDQRSSCVDCNGPLWLNAKGQIVCRWCGRLNLDFSCSHCGTKKLRQGSAGATRWVEQLGKSFPGIVVREIKSKDRDVLPAKKRSIVVATPGIEPVAVGGYAAAVLIDCSSQLNRDSLRAPEDALRAWLNALGFMAPDGKAVAVGVSSEVSKALSLGQVVETVQGILDERVELGFPPAKRFLSAIGDRAVLEVLASRLAEIPEVTVLGFATAQGSSSVNDVRLLVSFSYGAGSEVSKTVKEFLGTLTSKSLRTSAKSGKNLRPVTFKFDDPRVI